MKLSEQIEALQARWHRYAKADCDPANGSATIQAAGQRTAKLADDLAPLLVAAKEQEAELATLKEGWHLTSFVAQHEADLLAIAEMMIAACAPPDCPHCKNGLPIKSLEEMQHGHWTGVTFDGHTLPSGEHVACLKRNLPTAASILREFREKKAKVNHD